MDQEINYAESLSNAMELYRKALSTKPTSLQTEPEMQPALKVVQDFFQIDAFGAMLLCPLISARLLGEGRVDRSEVLEVIGKDYSQAITMARYFDRYILEGLLTKSGGHFRSGDGVALSEKAYRAILRNKPFESKRREMLHTFAGFLECFVEAIDLLEDDFTKLDLISDELEQLSDTFEHLPELKFLAWLKLDLEDMVILLHCCSKYYFERINSYNVEAIIDSLGTGKRRNMQLMNDLKDGASGLIKHELLKFHSTSYKTVRNMQLTDRAIAKLCGCMVLDNDIRKLSRGKLLSPEKFSRQQLFYNANEEAELLRLHALLGHDSFTQFCDKAGKLGMQPGVTVLFFGKPGTGKTSTVYELAAETDRMVYKIDFEAIKSAWVGESEKNLIQVFDEYSYLCQQFDSTPILLLNECDGLLKKRLQNSNTPVGEMHNTMVTLLLEQLENFQGILFATMNEPNFDPAFERRFLFKHELSLPDEPTRFKILRENFNDSPEDLLTELAHNHSLSGGQIANVKKKYLIRQLLEDEVKPEQVLKELFVAEQVLSHRKSTQKIGFIHP